MTVGESADADDDDDDDDTDASLRVWTCNSHRPIYEVLVSVCKTSAVWRIATKAKVASMHEPFWGKPTAIGDSRETNYEHSPYVIIALLSSRAPPPLTHRPRNAPTQVRRRAHLHHDVYPLVVRKRLRLRVVP